MQFWKTTALSLATILVVYISLIGVSMGADLNHSNYRVKDDHQFPDNYLAQATSTSELRDINPDSPYFEALKSLMERYGCAVGFGDRTYRPDRTIVRGEVASITSACISVMDRLVQENVVVLREDVDKLQRLLIEINELVKSTKGR
jgi:hypothetical protein